MVVEPRFAGVYEGNPDVDEITVNVGKADLVLNLHGGTRSMMLTLASGARFRAGFAHHRYSFIYSHQIPRAQEILGIERRVHTAEHLASAVFWLGVPQAEIPRANLAAKRPEMDLPANYAVIHPFASAAHKTWPAERFIAFGKHLRETGIEPIVIAGPTDNPAPFSDFQVLHSCPIRRIKELTSRAALFIGNDSGPAHIAAAFGVPVIVLFGSSDPVTWAPWRTESQVLTSPAGIEAIMLEDVIAAAEALKVRT